VIPIPTSWPVRPSAALTRRLEEATGWFYRTRIKSPRDTAAQIAGECGEPLEHVEAWIAEAYRLLSLGEPTE
jgi:hypothetical protein